NLNLATLQVQALATPLDSRVCSQDRARCSFQAVVIRSQTRHRRPDSGFDPRHRKALPDYTRRTNEYLLRSAAELVSGDFRHPVRVFQALPAGASIGVSRANDDSLCV